MVNNESYTDAVCAMAARPAVATSMPLGQQQMPRLRACQECVEQGHARALAHVDDSRQNLRYRERIIQGCQFDEP